MTVVAFKKQSAPCCEKDSDSNILVLLEKHHAKVRCVRRGEPVCLTIDAADSVYYVKLGSIKLVRYSQSGDEVMIDQYRAGSVFGNLCFCSWSMCCESIAREVAVALEDSVIMVTSFESLKRDFRHCTEAIFSLLEDYCRRLAVARMRIESLVLHEAEERLARALLIMTSHQEIHYSPAILNAAVTHEELAHVIGVTRPFVTRLMGQLRDRGLIEPLAAGQILIHQEKIANAYP